MNCLKLTLPASGTIPALLTLPQAMSAHELLGLEHSVIETLAQLRRVLAGDDMADSLRHSQYGPDAGALEYASWLPDPGALEVESWVSNMQSPAR